MNYDVVIAGGGAAGLTSSAYLSSSGLRTVVFERQGAMGGLVQSVTRKGFTFDMGLRAIEDSGIVLPMFKQLGISMDYVESPVSIGVGDRIMKISGKESVDEYERFLESFYPESKEDISRIVKVIKQVMKDMDVLYGVENPLFRDLKSDYEYIFRTLLPWILKFMVTIGKINRMNQPVETFLDDLTDNSSLKSIIGQHFFRKTPAFFAMSYFSVYLDYLYPKGGTGTVTRLLKEYIEEKGVSIKNNTRVTAIDPEKHTIMTEYNETCEYKKLIWAADLKELYRMIDVKNISGRRLKRAVENESGKLSAFRGGDSVFSLFLSVDEKPEYFRSVSEGHFFYTPEPTGLGGLHTEDYRNLIENPGPDGDFRNRVVEYLKSYFRLTTYEISIPVLKDPAMAPKGQTGLIVSCLFEYDLVRIISDKGWYEEFRHICTDLILYVLDGSIYPGIKNKLLDSFTSTPLSIEMLTGNIQGAITGWAFEENGMPVVNRMQKVSRSVLTPINDIYQAGQWTYSPSGLPMSFLTGKLAADRVIRELK